MFFIFLSWLKRRIYAGLGDIDEPVFLTYFASAAGSKAFKHKKISNLDNSRVLRLLGDSPCLEDAESIGAQLAVGSKQMAGT